MTLNKKKYQQAILYFCWKLKKEIRGKKKLAKLLYYLDFDYYEKYQLFFTGEIYKKLPMGPFPVLLDEVTKEMKRKKELNIEKVKQYGEEYNPTEVYIALKEPDTSVFSDDEKKMLDRIVKKYGNLNGKELENLTHMEAPYIGTAEKEEIPYELSFYRGTEF